MPSWERGDVVGKLTLVTQENHTPKERGEPQGGVLVGLVPPGDDGMRNRKQANHRDLFQERNHRLLVRSSFRLGHKLVNLGAQELPKKDPTHNV